MPLTIKHGRIFDHEYIWAGATTVLFHADWEGLGKKGLAQPPIYFNRRFTQITLRLMMASCGSSSFG